MSDSPITLVENILPIPEFQYFANQLMSSDSYACRDFATYTTEADGSILQFGQNTTEPVKLHESCMENLIFVDYFTHKLTHNIYYKLKPQFDLLKKLLNVKDWLLLRANCLLGASENFVGSWHTDLGRHIHEDKSKTAVLYLNSNNGGTKFKESDSFVQSQANRCVVFKGTTEHAGVWATDKKLRFVLNMNYTEK